MEPTLLPTQYIDKEPDPVQETPDNGVSLSPPASDPDTGVSLSSPGNAPVVIPDPVASERAKKIHEGIGEHLQDKSVDEIKQDIQNGNEENLRQQAARKMDYDKSLRLNQSLIDLANSKGGPLDPDEVARMVDPFNPNNRPVPADSIVETQYGTKYIGSIQEAIGALPSNPVEQAQQEIPEEVDNGMLKGGTLVAKMEYAKHIREDIEATMGKQSIPGRVWDVVKQMWQPYNEAKMRGLVPDTGYTTGIDLGNNLQAQADKVFGLPMDQYTQVLKSVTDKLAQDNPSLAHRFAEYVEGLSSDDRMLDSVFTYMLPLDAASIGKFGMNIARKVSLANRSNTAIKQLVKVADKIQTDKVARAEATGDLDKAAEIKGTDLVLQNMNGSSDPIKIATDDTLLTSLNQDKDKIAAAPGNLSREQVTRIMDQYVASGKAILERIVNAARINRIPMALATQNAIKIIRDAAKEYYPGIRNAILDVSNPLYEPKSNTFWHEVTFGNFGGKLFSNPETAKNFAILHNLEDTHIVEGYGVTSSKATEKMLQDKAKIESNITDWEQTVQRRKAEAADTKLTPQERAKAKEQADGIKEQITQARQTADDLAMRLKGNETYDRVKLLESEINQLKVRNKELRKSVDKGEHITESIRWAGEQIKAKADEVNAIKQGKAEVIRPNTIEQQGVGWKIVVRRPLVETDKAVRDLLIRDTSGKLIPEATSTNSQTGFKAIFNAAIGKYRGADDTLALNESIQRKIGTYTQSLFKEWAQQEAQYIRQIASGVIREDPVTGDKIPWIIAKPKAIYGKLFGDVRSNFNEFTRTLDFARDARDPDTGKIGYFFQTPGELNNHYLTNFDRPATFPEHQAYFAFVRMVEGDRIMREIAEFRNRARLGAEQFSISARGADGKTVKSDFFDGIRMKHFPGGDDVIMVMARKLGEEKLYNLGGAGIGPTKLEQYKEMVKNGQLSVIRVYAPEYRPLREFSDIAGNEHVRYILTDNAANKPLEYNHVSRRGGGHFEYDYDHYIKQANMYHQFEGAGAGKGRYKSVYTGDTTFMPTLNRIMGRDIADKMNTIASLIRDGKEAEAEAFTKQHLPIEWDKLRAMFKPGRDAEGKVTPSQLDLDARNPFTVVDKGKTVYGMNSNLEDSYGKGIFKDGTRSGSDNRQFNVQFNTERESSGLNHLEDVGTQGNPLYAYSPTGKMIDPITTMNRSLNRIVNSVYMDDYKMYAVEHWLREAETHLKPDLKDIARSSPFYVFQMAKDKTAFREGTPWQTVRNLLSNQYKINQFIGVPSTFDTAVHALTQQLVDSAYSSFGPEASRGIGAKAMTIAPLWMLNRIKDPVTIARSLTFHAKLGVFNPAQLLVQMNTFAQILAISPMHGTSGTFATFLHSWTEVNHSPEFLKYVDNIATKFGWKPGELTEARTLLNRTGFANVAGEYANLNTALKTDFVGNDIKGFFNAGTWFFRKGEQSTRLGAWYTAYREFRVANPTGPVSQADLGKMLQRADLLTANMSRASNSALNSGGLSLTTQFVNYSIRQAELFMGNRIDKMAKMRLAAFYTLLYGAPSAVGLTGLNMANQIRQEAMQRGYVVGDNWITTAVMEGLPHVLGAMITGKGDFRKGNNYNLADRYGNPGLTQLNDALKSDKPWYMLAAGAAGTTLLNTWEAKDPFFKAIGSMIDPSNKNKQYKLTGDNFVDFFKEVSTVNQTWKLFTALNSGRWISKNEGYIGDVSKTNAAFMAITGLSPQQQDDAYVIKNIKQSEIDFQKWVEKKATIEMHRYLQAVRDKNPEQAATFAKHVNTMLEASGYPVDRQASFYAKAVQDYKTQIDSQDFAFATKGVPQSRTGFMGIPTPFTTQDNLPQARLQQYRDKAKLQHDKGQ